MRNLVGVWLFALAAVGAPPLSSLRIDFCLYEIVPFDVPLRPVVCRIMLRRTVYVYVCCACKLGKKAKTKGKKPAAPKPKKDAPGVAGLKPTVGTQFKDQLHNLMDMIRWVGCGADDR